MGSYNFLGSLLFAAFISSGLATPDVCLESPGSCINPTYTSCHLNGAVVDSNYCYQNVCREGEFSAEYDCPTGFNYHGDGVCFHISHEAMAWKNAKTYCEKFGGSLVVIKSEKKQTAIDEFLKDRSRGENYDTTIWIGAYAAYTAMDWFWIDETKVSEGYTHFKNGNYIYPVGLDYALSFAEYTAYGFNTYWQPAQNESNKYALCETDCKPKGCKYEGQYYGYGEVVWEDPECRCTVLICGKDGEVHLEEKEKPCCTYDGKPYGNGEVIFTDECYELKCRDGKVVSLPHCPEGWTFVSYNDVGSCYHISSSEMSYYDADEYCRSIDGNLAQITSKCENEAVEDHLFANLLPSGCKYGWLGATASLDKYGYLNAFKWSSGIVQGIPVSGIYDDFCPSNPPSKTDHNQFLSIVYTGSADTNNYCWVSSDGYEKKAAVCEKCVVCEHSYMSQCAYQGKLYDDGAVVASVEYAPGPCYTKVCSDGRIVRTDKICKYPPKPTPTQKMTYYTTWYPRRRHSKSRKAYRKLSRKFN